MKSLRPLLLRRWMDPLAREFLSAEENTMVFPHPRESKIVPRTYRNIALSKMVSMIMRRASRNVSVTSEVLHRFILDFVLAAISECFAQGQWPANHVIKISVGNRDEI